MLIDVFRPKNVIFQEACLFGPLLFAAIGRSGSPSGVDRDAIARAG